MLPERTCLEKKFWSTHVCLGLFGLFVWVEWLSVIAVIAGTCSEASRGRKEQPPSFPLRRNATPTSTPPADHCYTHALSHCFAAAAVICDFLRTTLNKKKIKHGACGDYQYDEHTTHRTRSVEGRSSLARCH